MACCGGGEEANRNSSINKTLVASKKKLGRMVKLLLLGAGESGKSTFAKQMKIIHQHGFKEGERLGYHTAIANNILNAMRTLIQQCARFEYVLSATNKLRAKKIMDIPRDQDLMLTQEVGDDIANLWQDPAIKQTFDRSNEYRLTDSTGYYFDNIMRISSPDYVPSEQDVLRSHVKTTGVLETTFEVEDITFQLVDVGGQRSERRKWIHCFESVTAILFCVAISEYDLKLYEDNETNRMHESLHIFKELCNTKWFQQTSIVLFLNKKDIFEEKIRRVPLTVCFPDYDGKPGDVNAGKEFIREKFVEVNSNKIKTIYVHFTCATDTTNISVVFDAVCDILLSKFLNTIGVVI